MAKRGGRQSDSFIFFRFIDYEDEYLNNCKLFMLSERSQALLIHAMQFIKWFNTRWLYDTSVVLTDSQLVTVRGWVGELEKELNMPCEIEESLATIAVAIQQIAVDLSDIKTQLVSESLLEQLDELEEMTQEIARAIGGVTIPIVTNGGP